MSQLHNKIQARKSTTAPVVYKSYSTTSEKDLTVNGRTVTGYLAVFNNKDSDGDILIKGCFAKSLQERGVDSTTGNKIAHLWQHDMKDPLGKYTVLKEDDYGLYFECPYDDIPQANRALKQFQSGTLDKFSIGYCYVWDKMEYDENADAFVCKELELYEGSVVTMAANDMTYFAGLKSEQRADELEILTEEANDAMTGLKPRKRHEIGQLISKFIALAKTKPQSEGKEALIPKPAAKKKGVGLDKLLQLK